MNRISPAVAGLLALNIAVFIGGSLLPNRGEAVVVTGAIWFPANEHFRLWQFVTYLFLHGSPGHIFFNMFALVSFGKILERAWGAGRFLVFYFLCGIGAAAIQTGINWHEFNGLHEQLVAAGVSPARIDTLLAYGGILPSDPAVRSMLIELQNLYRTPMVGASGAIYGVLVAFGLLYPNAKLALMFVPIPVAAKFVIPGLLLLDLFSGVTGFSIFGAGIAHFAHLGGAAIGFLLMLLWRNRGQRVDRFGRLEEMQTFR